MGKIRFKLSHVMPHVWFYKLREVSKIGESHAYGSSQSKPVSSRKATYTSPVNHKAIDIPFPVETPRRSPLVEAPLTFPEGIAVLSPLHSVEISADNWSLTNLPSTLNHHLNMDNYAEEDNFHGLSSAPKSKSGVVNSGFTFDVRELEIRLKALGSEDRRKYYTSPMFSDALPSPILDATHTAASHAESFDMQEYSLVDVHGGENRRFPLKVVYEEGKPFDGSGGGGFYRSSNESNSLRQSTSSSNSDTGFERGSSSMWERDVFSITSDGSEAFTTADDVDSNHMMQRSSRQHHRNPNKEKVNTAQNSPLPYASSHDFATIHNDISIGFYIGDHRDIAAVQKDIMNGLNCETEAMQSDINSGSGLYGHNCDIAALAQGDINRSGWSTYKSNGRPSSKASPSNSLDSQQGRHAANLANKYRAVVNQGKEPPFLDFEGSNQLPLVQYESSDDQKSQHRKVSSSEFSYMGCKERLLSGRMSFDQCSDTAASESELETISNYTKFKLKKKGNIHSKMSIIGSLSPDLGLYNKLSSNKQSNNMDQEAYANGMSSRFDSEGNPAHFKGSSRRNSVDHSRSPYQKGLMGDIKSNTTYDQGPSWFKATRRAVREKTRDPSFQHFSLKPGAAQSRVFDSFAMVKCSYDPKQDFKESMVEMILEKDLHSSHDMVELLQCYLTLNSENYHDTIVKVFTEVWSEVCQHV